MLSKLRYFFNQFIPETRAEWTKVTRPSFREVRSTTVVVIVTSVIFAVYLWLADLLIAFAYNGMFDILGLG